MSKRALLWSLGGVAFVFTYIAAVNVTQAGYGYDFAGRATAFTACEGLWNPLDWFDGCAESRPARLGVLALGIALLLVCGYFAEKGLVKHEVMQDPRDKSHWCRDCAFESWSSADAYRHRRAKHAPTARVAPSTPSGNTNGFGATAPKAAAPAAPPTAPATSAAPPPSAPATPEFKTCPDCAELVLTAARKCRFCDYRFDVTETATGSSSLIGPGLSD